MCKDCVMGLCVYVLFVFVAAGPFLKLDLIRPVQEPERSPLTRRATMPIPVRHVTSDVDSVSLSLSVVMLLVCIDGKCICPM